MIALSWLCILFICRLLDRSWWSPGALLALVLGGSALATMLFAPEYYMSLEANLVLQMFVLSVLLGSVVSAQLPQHPRAWALDLQIRSQTGFVLFGIVASIAALVALLSSHGLGFSALLRPSEFMSIAQAATKQRYLDGISTPLYGNIASACVLAYVAVLVMHVVTTRRIKLIALAPVVIFLITNALVTTRSTLVYLLLIAILSYAFAISVSRTDRHFPGIFTAKTIVVLACTAGLLIVIFVAFQMLRFGESHAKPVSEILGYLRRWPWGSLPGFSLWWDGMAPAELRHLPGYYTFMGFLDNLGIEERSQGGYQGFVLLTAEEPGNIYTSFRGLIEDFGLLGSGLFLTILGFLGGASKVGSVFPSHVRLAVFLGVSMWIVTSFIFSFWAYIGNVLAAVLVPLLFLVFGNHSKPRRKRLLRG